MLKITVLCLLAISLCLAEDDYGSMKIVRRRRLRRPGRPYGSIPVYPDDAPIIRHPGYGYGRDIVVVDDYDRVPPKRTEVIRDHDEGGYDLPKSPRRKPTPRRIPPPVKTDVIRDHDEAGYDLPPKRRPIIKEPYPPVRKSYDEVPIPVSSYDRKPSVVTQREEHIKETPYGVQREVHERKHVVPPHHPHPKSGGHKVADSVEHYHYDMEKTPDCAYATNDSICLEDKQYPVDVIKYAIKKDQNYLKRLLSDVVYQSADNTVDGLTKNQEETYSYAHYFGTHTKGTHHGAPYTDYTYNREYYKKGGYLCPSSVAYVRPKRARNTRGQWKMIVNLPTDYSAYGHKYTQTVRLEKCTYPGAPCSYMGSEYHSKCLQKTNFERLLVWTYDAGLHIDIFRLPVACSCHMGGHGGKDHGRVKSY